MQRKHSPHFCHQNWDTCRGKALPNIQHKCLDGIASSNLLRQIWTCTCAKIHAISFHSPGLLRPVDLCSSSLPRSASFVSAASSCRHCVVSPLEVCARSLAEASCRLGLDDLLGRMQREYHACDHRQPKHPPRPHKAKNYPVNKFAEQVQTHSK
eukprot:SAG31_NODE_4197_length_3483_cov_1.755319_3_plen_154_part_00